MPVSALEQWNGGGAREGLGIRLAIEAKERGECRREKQKLTSQSQAAHPNSRVPAPYNSETLLVQDLRYIHPLGASADGYARSILRGYHLTKEAKIDHNASLDARSTRNRRVATATDSE